MCSLVIHHFQHVLWQHRPPVVVVIGHQSLLGVELVRQGHGLGDDALERGHVRHLILTEVQVHAHLLGSEVGHQHLKELPGVCVHKVGALSLQLDGEMRAKVVQSVLNAFLQATKYIVKKN